MTIKQTTGNVAVSTQVLRLTKVKRGERPTLDIDESARYTVTVATTIDGEDNYSVRAGGVFKLFLSGPTAQRAQTMFNAARAIGKIVTGQAGYQIEGGLPQRTINKIEAARAGYDGSVEAMRRVVGQYVKVESIENTTEDPNNAGNGLEGMTKR